MQNLTDPPGTPPISTGDARAEFIAAALQHKKEREERKAAGLPEPQAAVEPTSNPKAQDHRNALARFYEDVFAKDFSHKLPTIGEAARAGARGIAKAGVEFVTTLADAANIMRPDAKTVAEYKKRGLNKTLEFLGDEAPTAAEFHDKGMNQIDALLGKESEKGAARALETLTQIGVGFIAGSKALPLPVGASNSLKIAQSAAAGAIAEVATIDPYQTRLSNLIENGPSAFRNPLTAFLAADPDDSRAVAKLKAGFEGLLTGAAMEGIIALGKGAWALRTGSRAAVRADATSVSKAAGRLSETLSQATAPIERVGVEQAPDGGFNLVDLVAGTTDAATREGSALAPVAQAKAIVGDARFKARAEAEIEATGAAGNPVAEKAAIDKVAREIFYEVDRPIELVAFPTEAEAQATAASINAAADNAAQPRANITSEQAAEVLRVADDLVTSEDPASVLRMQGGTDFNFNYSSSPAEARSVIEAISEILPDATHLQRNRIATGMGQSHDETEALAAQILDGFESDPAKAGQLIRAAFDNTEKLPQIVRAVDLFMHGLGSKIARLGRAADAMADNAVAHSELLQALNHMWEIHADLAGTVSSTARTLESRKMVNGGVEITNATAHAEAKEAEAALKELRKARNQREAIAPKDFSSKARASEFNLAKARRKAQAIIKKIEDAAKPVDDSPEAVAKAADNAAERNKQLLNDASIQREGPLPNDLEAPKAITNPVEDLGKLLDAEDRALQRIIDNRFKAAREPQLGPEDLATSGTTPVDRLLKGPKPPKQSPFDKMNRAELRAFARQVHLAEGDPKQIMAAMHSAKKLTSEPNSPTLMQSILGYRMEAMLSGPKTLAVNELSNMLTAFHMPLEIWWSGVRTGGAKSVISKEASAELRAQGADMLAGNFMEMREAWRAGAKAFRTEVNTLDEAASAIGDGGGRFVDDAGTNSVARGLANLGHLPSRLLMSRDEFYKTLAYRNSVRAQSMLLAREEGLEGARFATRIAEDMRAAFTLDTDGSWINGEFVTVGAGRAKNPVALQYARTATFQNALGAETWAGKIQAAVIDHPSGRLILPFVRTPANLFRYSWERTPLLNRFTIAWKADIAAGGKQAALAQAKTELGAMIWATGGALVLAGRITGSGPKNYELRRQWLAAGNQPYSLDVPGVGWMSYRRGDPQFTAIGIMADLFAVSGEMNADNMLEYAEAWLAAVASNVSSRSYMQGMTDFMEAVSSGDGRLMKHFLETTAGSFIPNVLRQTDGNEIMRETRGMTDEMMARIPGFSEMLEPRRNIFGEKIMRPPGYLNRALNPYTIMGKPSNEDTQMQLLELGKAMSVPQERHGKVDLTDRDTYSNGKDQSPYDRMLELMSHPGEGRETARQDIEMEMATDRWKTASKEKRFIIASEIISGHQDRAFNAMLKEFPKVKAALKSQVNAEEAAIRRRSVIDAASKQFNP